MTLLSDGQENRSLSWLKRSKQVCGMENGTHQHKETWSLNRDVEERWLLATKQMVCHKAWLKAKSAEDKHTLDIAKKVVDATVL